MARRGLQNLRLEIVIPLSTDNVTPEELTFITKKFKRATINVLRDVHLYYRDVKVNGTLEHVTIKESNALIKDN